MHIPKKLIQFSAITISLIILFAVNSNIQAANSNQGSAPSWGYGTFPGMGGQVNPMMGMMNPMMMNPMMMNPMMMNPMMGMMNPMTMGPMMGGYSNSMGQMPGGQMMDPKQYEQWFKQWTEMMHPKQYEQWFKQWTETMKNYIPQKEAQQ
jgi:hypothetical protein